MFSQYSDKTWVFDQSEHAQGPIYVMINYKCLTAYIDNFFQQFEQSLSTDRYKLTLEEPLTNEDCNFLRQVCLPCDEDCTLLNLTSLSKEEVQSYGIVFHALDSKSTRFIH